MILYSLEKQNNNFSITFREFSGFALSHQDWEDELINLVDDLKDKEDVDNSATFYTASYDGMYLYKYVLTYIF